MKNINININFKNIKLRDMILAVMVFVVTCTLIIVGYFTGRQFEQVLTERAVSDCRKTVNTVKRNTETLIAYAEDFAKYLSLDETLCSSIESYQEYSKHKISPSAIVSLKKKWEDISTKLIFSTSMIHNLDIYSGTDLVYSYHDLKASEKEEIIPKEIITAAVAQASPLWTDLLTFVQFKTYNSKEEHGFAVVKSVRNSSSKVSGAIAVYIRESSFSEILSAVSDGDRNRCFLVNTGNTVIAGKDSEDLFCDITSLYGLTGGEYALCLQNGVMLKESPDGIPIAYVLEDVGKNGFKIVCEMTLDDLEAQKKGLEAFLWIMEGIAVVLTVFSARFAADRITRPLNKLTSIMQQMQEDGGSSHLRFPEGEKGEIGALGTHFNALMDRLDESRERVYREQRQRRHNEVRLLQAQIVPHFLYNTLGIVSSLIKLGMTAEAELAVRNLASFYRLSLSSGKEIISISDEIELTQKYMDLQKLRYIEYMEYSIEFDEDVKEVQIPKLTIQPLIENVLHHALRPNGEKCTICVTIRRDVRSDGVLLSVLDNGRGMTAERLAQLRESLTNGKNLSDSFGILNIHQRLKLLYGDLYYMEINSQENEYTEFRLFLPGVPEENYV